MSLVQHSEPQSADVVHSQAHLVDPLHADAHGPHINYFFVFLALCVFTTLSVVFDLLKSLPKGAVVFLVLAVAVAKALCVMAFFMHLKFEGRWKYIILAPTSILAVGLMVALAPDFALHYYTPDVPQTRGDATAGEFQTDYEMLHGTVQPSGGPAIPPTIQ